MRREVGLKLELQVQVGRGGDGLRRMGCSRSVEGHRSRRRRWESVDRRLPLRRLCLSLCETWQGCAQTTSYLYPRHPETLRREEESV